MGYVVFDTKPAGKRWSEAEAVRVSNPAIHPSYANLFPAERVQRFIANSKAGYFAIPEDAITSPEYSFSRKRGPFYDLIAERDLREFQRTLLTRALPKTALFHNREIPCQFTGIRFGLKGINRYTVRLTDLVHAQQEYARIRKSGKIVEKQPGLVRAIYAGGVEARIYGLKKDTATEINATVSNIPSRRPNEPPYAPTLHLETLDGTSVTRGIFDIRSAVRPRDLENRTVYKFYNGHLIREDAFVARGPIQQRHALYMEDLLAFLLVNGITQKQYHVEINHPFPSFSSAMVQFANDIQSGLVIVTPKAKKLLKKKPSKTKREQAFITAFQAFT